MRRDHDNQTAPHQEATMIDARRFRLPLYVLALAGVLAAPASHAATQTYTGKATFSVTRTYLPLANGASAAHVSHDVVATIEPSEPGFIFGDCAGLGYVEVDGDARVHAFCTFSETVEDGFVIEVETEPGAGGTVRILGGSGKWANATGEGTLESTYAEGYRGTYRYEFSITTP